MGTMTKEKYISLHPKSKLAAALVSRDWPSYTEIRVGGGLDAPFDKRSNLYKDLQNSTGEYCLGGHRWRGTEGWWYAVRVK